MAITYLNSRTIQVGPVRCIRTRLTTGGSNETITGISVRAASATAHRAFALTRTPLTDGANDANIRPTAANLGTLTCTIDGGASGDQFAFNVWSW